MVLIILLLVILSQLRNYLCDSKIFHYYFNELVNQMTVNGKGLETNQISYKFPNKMYKFNKNLMTKSTKINVSIRYLHEFNDSSI